MGRNNIEHRQNDRNWGKNITKNIHNLLYIDLVFNTQFLSPE